MLLVQRGERVERAIAELPVIDVGGEELVQLPEVGTQDLQRAPIVVEQCAVEVEAYLRARRFRTANRPAAEVQEFGQHSCSDHVEVVRSVRFQVVVGHETPFCVEAHDYAYRAFNHCAVIMSMTRVWKLRGGIKKMRLWRIFWSLKGVLF